MDISPKPRVVISKVFDTPLGDMLAAVSEDTLCYLEFSNADREFSAFEDFCKKWNLKPENGVHELLNKTRIQLEAYFLKKLQQFELPVILMGSPFQTMVWNQLIQIPYGETCSYEEISLRLNNPLAIRAIAHANGQNPIAIIVPCHRVIGKDGSLTGYAGGLWRKKFLLEHERTGPVQMELDFYIR